MVITNETYYEALAEFLVGKPKRIVRLPRKLRMMGVFGCIHGLLEPVINLVLPLIKHIAIDIRALP